MKGKVKYNTVSAYEGRYDLYFTNGLTDEDRNKIVEYAESQVGAKYAYLLILWQIFRYCFNWFLPYVDRESTICSELVNTVYKKAVKIDLCPWVKYPSPQDLSMSEYLQMI